MNDRQEPYYYEDVIDLRELVETLWNHKWIIVAAVLLAAAAAYLTDSFILPPQYEASAHIGIRRPTFQANLEPSIDSPSSLENYQQLRDLTESLPELAEADDVWMSACVQAMVKCVGEDSLKPELEAELVGSNQLKLTVTSSDPRRAAEFANIWAGEVIDRWNELYGNENVELARLEEDVEAARERWAEAQKALEVYLPHSQINVLEVKLLQTRSRLNRYLEEIEDNERLIRDARSGGNRLLDLDPDSALPLGEALSIIALQQRSSGGISGTQFQLSGSELFGGGYTVGEARGTIATLVRALESQNENMIEKIDQAAGEITALAVELEEEQYKIDQLEQERDRARQEYNAMAGYLDETRINQRNQKKAAYSIAKAIVSQKESGQSAVVLTALAGIVAGMIAASAVLFFEWWTTEDEEA